MVSYQLKYLDNNFATWQNFFLGGGQGPPGPPARYGTELIRKLFGFTVNFSVLLKKGFSFSFMTFVFLLFALLIFNLAEISSPPCSKSFKYFLTLVISNLICPSCLKKKCVSVDINLGIWSVVSKSLFTNAIASSLCINDSGSTSFL